jgi:DNA-binding beta-propeller fold protein YncE
MYLFLLIAVFTADPTTLLIPPFKHTLGFHRVSKFYLNMFLGPNFYINDPEGVTAVRMKEGDNPNTSSDDHILTLFAVNSGTSQIVYNIGLLKLGIFGNEGTGEKEFSNPRGIAANPGGDVYIADTGNDRIVKLRYHKGELVWEQVFADSLKGPQGVALDSKKRVYVTEDSSSKIIVFDSLGNILYQWQHDIINPGGIAVIDQDDVWNYYKENFVVVIDKANKRISKFNLNGRLLNIVDARSIGFSEADFAYLAIDYYANVYVTDRLNHQVHKFDRNLNYIISFGKEGTGDDEFYSPRGITIWRRFGQVFITEAEGGQYYWLGLDGYMVGCFPEKFTPKKPGTTIALYLTELAEVKVNIFDEQGKVIRLLTPEHFQKPGEALIIWDGRDNNGNVVSPGSYQIKLAISPTYSAPRRYFKKELESLVQCTQEPVVKEN